MRLDWGATTVVIALLGIERGRLVGWAPRVVAAWLSPPPTQALDGGSLMASGGALLGAWPPNVVDEAAFGWFRMFEELTMSE